jgi:DNA-directed RNA polymerase specialized sigma24 family protein
LHKKQAACRSTVWTEGYGAIRIPVEIFQNGPRLPHSLNRTTHAIQIRETKEKKMSSPDFIQFDSFGIPLSAVVASANPAKFAFSHSHQSPGDALKATLERKHATRNGTAIEMEAPRAAPVLPPRIPIPQQRCKDNTCWNCLNAGVWYETPEERVASQAAADARAAQMELERLKSRVGVVDAPPAPAILSEFSAIRKPGDCWKAPKISVTALNEVHALFADSELSLEDYSTQLAAILDPEGGTDVFGFLSSIAGSLETNTYSTRTKFGAKLKDAFVTFRDDGNDVAETDSDDEDTEAASDYKAPKSRNSRSLVENAYGGFVAGTVNQDAFLTATRKFALRWVSWQFKGCEQHGQTEDDITQIAMVKMWNALPTFKDSSEGFVPWFRTIIKNTLKDTKETSLKESMRHAPLFIVNEDGDEADNPGMYGTIQYRRNGKVAYQEPLPQHARPLPEFIQGLDLQICQYIREGYNYEKIARVLSTTEPAIEARVRKMRNKIEEMKAPGSK